ncbi:TadE family type IV pilus minor pilin, partial [Streptomyces sp. NPDC057644]|uniref:TadE family type IV pilus minor pilin n=1 Tax=Streptomyces sp. NPDC057644 TaxID=3346191 RepID=UPI0036BDBC2D
MRSSEVRSGPFPGAWLTGSCRCLSWGRLRGRAPSAEGRGDRGAVTAEAAVVIPVLVAFAMALLWALTAVSDQIRCVDAARAGAPAPPPAATDAAGGGQCRKKKNQPTKHPM